MCAIGPRSAGSSPVHFAVILPARRILSAQLDARKDALLVRHGANELDRPVHAARHIHQIADANVAPVGAHPAGGGRLAANQRVQRGFALECCARGEIEVWRGFDSLGGDRVSAHSVAGVVHG
jgi:hypothetical protein